MEVGQTHFIAKKQNERAMLASNDSRHSYVLKGFVDSTQLCFKEVCVNFPNTEKMTDDPIQIIWDMFTEGFKSLYMMLQITILGKDYIICQPLLAQELDHEHASQILKVSDTRKLHLSTKQIIRTYGKRGP